MATREQDPRRSASRERVMRVLREAGATSRAAIAERTSLSRATVSSVVAELQADGLVVESEPERDAAAGSGRPPALVQLDRSAGAALGIDFGRRHLRVVAADLGHRILAERRVDMVADHRADEDVALAARLVDEILAEAALDRSRLVGVGMGLPGPVKRTGELGSSTILPGWLGVRADELMTGRLGMHVRVDNDANLGALGEWTWGAARGRSDVAYLKLATGIGAGLIFEGRPFRGAGGTAGEIGHTTVDPQGPMCRCGNRGCLETLVGAQALVDLLRPALGDVTLPDVLRRAADGDPACRRVVADAGAAVGAATASLCNLLNPELVVVGGDLAAAGELLLAPLRDALQRAAIPSAAAQVEVVPGVLHERAEVLGAVALALRDSGLAVTEGDAAALA